MANPSTGEIEKYGLNRSRLLYLISTTFAAGGRNAYYVGAAWIIADLSKNPGSVAVLLALGSIAELAASAPAGHLADRFDRRILCIACDAVRILLLAATGAGLFLNNPVHVLYASVIFYSVIDRIYLVSLQSMIPSLVGARNLLSFNSLSYVGMQTGNLLAAFGIGFLLDILPAALCFLLIAGSFAISLIGAVMMKDVVSKPSSSADVQSAQEEDNKLVGDRPLMPRLSPFLNVVYALIYAMGMLVSLLASSFVLQELGGSAVDFGTLESGWAAGSIIGSALLLLRWSGRFGSPAILPILILSGSVLAGFYLSRSLTLNIVQMIVLGASYNLARILIDVEVQRAVPDQELGRAKGKLQVTCMGFGLIVYSAIAVFGKAVAPSTTLTAFGLVMIICALSIYALRITKGGRLSNRLL